MIHAILDNSNLINSDHLAAAIAIVDYAERSAQWIFQAKTGDKDADRLFWELDRHPEGMTRSEIYRDIFRNNRGSTDVSMTLGILQENGLADLKLEPSRGTPKPTERWFSKRHFVNS